MVRQSPGRGGRKCLHSEGEGVADVSGDLVGREGQGVVGTDGDGDVDRESGGDESEEKCLNKHVSAAATEVGA